MRARTYREVVEEARPQSAAEVVEFIEQQWGASPESRTEFLSDPGGWLAYTGVAATHEVAAAATVTITEKWTP